MDILVIWLSYLASIERAAVGAMAGGDTHIIEVSKKWNSLGHKVVVLTGNSGKLLLNVVGARLEICQASMPFENVLSNRSLGEGILYILRPLRALFIKFKRRFDVIVTSSHYPVDVLTALFLHLRNPRSRIVVYLHGISIPTDNMFRSLVSAVYNLLGLLISIRFAHLIFVINIPTREYLLRLGVERERIVITTNGVKTDEIAHLRSEKIFDACFLGRLVKSKGVYDLVSTWKIVCNKRPNARLVILGDGPEKGRLKKLISEAGLEANITLFGFVFGNEKYKILKSSHMLIFPSYVESWGISIAEAMACGLPVVAYNLRVYKEIFDDNLVTVPLGDVDAMAKKVILLLENSSLANEIGEAGREFVKRYSWSKVAERELSDILKLVNQCDEDARAFL